MDKQLLEYLRDMAFEMSAMAEDGNFKTLSHIFGMAALGAGQLLGPAIVFSQERSADERLFSTDDDDLDRSPTEPVN